MTSFPAIGPNPNLTKVSLAEPFFVSEPVLSEQLITRSLSTNFL